MLPLKYSAMETVVSFAIWSTFWPVAAFLRQLKWPINHILQGVFINYMFINPTASSVLSALLYRDHKWYTKDIKDGVGLEIFYGCFLLTSFLFWAFPVPEKYLLTLSPPPAWCLTVLATVCSAVFYLPKSCGTFISFADIIVLTEIETANEFLQTPHNHLLTWISLLFLLWRMLEILFLL